MILLSESGCDPATINELNDSPQVESVERLQFGFHAEHVLATTNTLTDDRFICLGQWQVERSDFGGAMTFVRLNRLLGTSIAKITAHAQTSGQENVMVAYVDRENLHIFRDA